jgi:Tfp pilus assembly protein FimT
MASLAIVSRFSRCSGVSVALLILLAILACIRASAISSSVMRWRRRRIRSRSRSIVSVRRDRRLDPDG